MGGARVVFALGVAGGAASAGAAVAQAFLVAHIIGRVFFGGAHPADILPGLGGLAVASLARSLLSWLSATAGATVAARVKTTLREQLVRRLQDLGSGGLAGERSGELSATLTRGVEQLDAYYSQYLPQLLIAVLAPLLILCFVIPLDWLSGLILLLTAPLIPVFMILIGHLARIMTERQWTVLSRMSAHFLDVLQGLPTLRLLRRARAETEEVGRISHDFRRATMGVLRVAFLSALTLELLATLGTALVAVTIGVRLLRGGITFEPALAILVLCPEFYGPLRALGARFHAGMEGRAAARRIFELLGDEATRSPAGGSDLKLQVSNPRGQVSNSRVQDPSSVNHQPSTICHESSPIHHPPSTINHLPLTISFDDIHFSYPGAARPALNGFTLELASGAITALVGPSGAGKSTAAKLLLRFMEPQRGRIVVNGCEVSDLYPDQWRRRVTWVPQRPHLFFGTIASNLRLARPEATAQEIETASRAAHLHDFVSSLPLGYETAIGEFGARLSGGQAQRLALARAFLKDAPLLILDEPTSCLDPACDALIRESIERLVAGRTTLLIAHRLGTVRFGARLAVMEAGRVVECGPPADLTAAGGRYSAMLEAFAGGSA